MVYQSWHDDRPLEEWEFPDPDDGDDGDATPTRRCPDCGSELYEDVAVCPMCGEDPSADASPWSERPLWWTALGRLGILAVLFALAGWLILALLR